MSVSGIIRGGSVWVEDPAEANRLHAKSGVGELRSGNVLCMSLTEAADAVRQGRLDVEGKAWTDLVDDDVEYLCYADLRERGLAIRQDPAGWRVWQRGERDPVPSWFTCRPMAERASVQATELVDLIGQVVAVVDEDGVVTFYDVESPKVRGQNPVSDWKGEGRLLGDRVYIDAAVPSPLGIRHGEGTLLSLVEAAWLVGMGRLQLDGDVHEQGRARHAHFDDILRVYQHLREAGVVAKSGYRFGTHLRGYSGGLDEGHAEWLLQAVGETDSLSWASISRGVRLAHGVRKQFVLAVAGREVQYVSLTWKRP